MQDRTAHAPRTRSATPGSPGRRTTGNLALVACLLAAAPGGALAQAGLGDPAPDFTLTASTGEAHTLSEAFGEQVQLLHMVGFA